MKDRIATVSTSVGGMLIGIAILLISIRGQQMEKRLDRLEKRDKETTELIIKNLNAGILKP